MENKDGVWRTIRGRRIFIGKGESLKSAMSRSGKFKDFKREDIKDTKDILSRNDKVANTIRKHKGQPNKVDDTSYKEGLKKGWFPSKDNQAPKNRIVENGRINEQGKTRVERNFGRYSEADRRELRHEELKRQLENYKKIKYDYSLADKSLKDVEKAKKELADFKAKKQSNNKIENGKREISYIGQDGKEHKMNEYKYPGEKYENWLKNKYGTDKEEEIIAKDRNKSYSRLRDEYYYENNTTPKKEMQELKRQTEQSNNKVESQDMPYERDLQDVVKSLNDEGSDFSWSINEYKDGKASLNVGVFMPDERGYVDRDVEFDLKGIKGNTAEGYSQIEDKIREWQDKHSSPDTFYDDDNKQEKTKNYVDKKKTNNTTKKDNNDWLPKATKIKEQGTSNRKQVSDNIQAHILSYYDSPQDFVEQMDVFDNLPTTWHRGEEMAKQGFYSVYYDDQRKFLDDLKINPSNKKFSDDKVFKTYTSLIGRESAKLYDKIKKHQAETINNYKKRKGK